MEDRKSHRALLIGAARQGVAQLLGVVICTAVLLLFVALTYARITLPRYTARYAQKDTQQVVNLIITVTATVIGILFSHCRRLTNEAETKSELRRAKLTIPRLHVHVEAAGGSHATMGLAAARNRQVWWLVAFYMFAITILGFLNTVLSVIFVVEPIISDHGYQSPAYIPIGIDIPWEWEGKVVDPCSTSIAEPGCSYNLAMTALSSELITYTPYTWGGVTFEPPNGTMGLPYWAMQHFSDQVQASPFEQEYRQYCLPVLDPHIITCTEEPFDQSLGRTNSSFLQYTPLDIVEAPDAEMYKIAIPTNATADNLKYRLSDQGLGVMLVRMYPEVIYNNITLITAVDSLDSNDSGANGAGYASLLYYLMYGVMPDESVMPTDGPLHFVAKCEFESIQYRDNYRSSWRKVDFTLNNGVSRAHVTEERCPNPRGNWTSGFGDLYFDLEGAADILSSTDGYCKLFNKNQDDSTGAHIFSGMSRLDAIVNKILHISATGWSQSIHHYAMMNQTVYDQPIQMTTYPHLYVIRINWTPTTYIGLILSLLITLSTYLLAFRWASATHRLGVDSETWNLLEPVDLMAYSLAAYQDLIHNLNTIEHRQKAMRGKVSSVLREMPVWEGTQSLIGLVKTLQSPASPTPDGSPVSAVGEKDHELSGPAADGKQPLNVIVEDTRDHAVSTPSTEGPNAALEGQLGPLEEGDASQEVDEGNRTTPGD